MIGILKQCSDEGGYVAIYKAAAIVVAAQNRQSRRGGREG